MNLTGNDIRRELDFINRLYAFNLKVSDRMIAELKDKWKTDDKKAAESAPAVSGKQEGTVV